MKKSLIKPKIGIVSGVGPLAGCDVLAKTFKHAAQAYGAIEDCTYPDTVLVSHGIKGVDNTGTLTNNFANEITGMVEQLEQNGANIIGVACNTAHIYLDTIRTKKDTTLVNLIDEVAKQASKYDHNYLLLTSRTSKEQKLYLSYLNKHDVCYSETTSSTQSYLDAAIELVMAYKLEEAGERLKRVLNDAKATGLTAVIAACTELPIAIDNCTDTFKLKVIDSNNVLAQTLTKKYYSKR